MLYRKNFILYVDALREVVNIPNINFAKGPIPDGCTNLFRARFKPLRQFVERTGQQPSDRDVQVRSFVGRGGSLFCSSYKTLSNDATTLFFIEIYKVTFLIIIAPGNDFVAECV